MTYLEQTLREKALREGSVGTQHAGVVDSETAVKQLRDLPIPTQGGGADAVLPWHVCDSKGMRQHERTSCENESDASKGHPCSKSKSK